jgi:hypothetical protein
VVAIEPPPIESAAQCGDVHATHAYVPDAAEGATACRPAGARRRSTTNSNSNDRYICMW